MIIKNSDFGIINIYPFHDDIKNVHPSDGRIEIIEDLEKTGKTKVRLNYSNLEFTTHEEINELIVALSKAKEYIKQ